MNVNQFISNYKNHPILFIGTGISLRYLKSSFTWDALLKKVAIDLSGNEEYYLDIKSACEDNGKYRYDKIATLLDEKFTKTLLNDRHGKFKVVNDKFYELMNLGVNVSRMKIYISDLLSSTELNEEMAHEITEFK